MKQTSIYRAGATALVLALFALAAGCSLDRPYPQKSLHMLAVAAPDAAPATGGKVLCVNSARIAKPFDGYTFVYKLGESTYTTDYYNGFVTSPDVQLTGVLSNWLDRSGLFSSVVDGDSGADWQLSADMNVTALYADYSDKSAPVAVIATKVILIDNSDDKRRIVFQKEYRETEPMASADPDKLVQAWERAYGRMLTELVSDLQKSPAVASDTAAVR